MEKLSLSLDKELEVMCKWGLNAEEWLFIRLLFIAIPPEGKPQYLQKYLFECSKTGFVRDTLISLKKKKILSKEYTVPEKGQTFNLDDLEFDESFIKKYFKLSCEAGEELFNAYPPFLYGQGGKLLPARNITKVGFTDVVDLHFAYCKAIKFDAEKHELVLRSLEFAKENNLIQYGIGEYYASRKWEEHILMMEQDKIGEFSTKFDTTEEL